MQRSMPLHELRSVFTHSSIHHWVFVKATMNEHLVQLLRLMPGVVHRQAGIIREQIAFEDWMKVLSAHYANTDDLNVGDWVCVCRGTYKGDVGYVTAIESWGGAKLLLVPHLSPFVHPESSVRLAKRIHSATPPEPALFDQQTVECIYGINPVCQEPYIYCFKVCTFEHGLICKAFDRCSVSCRSVYIPTQLLFLFQSASHPGLARATFPWPLEWYFEEGDVVHLYLAYHHP